MELGIRERTLILIKPDGVRRALVGEILGRFERAGLRIAGLKMVAATKEQASTHYDFDDIAGRHSEKIWRQLVEYVTDEPIVAAVLEGDGAIGVVRKLCGTTEPASSAAGTIRGDYCHVGYRTADVVGVAVRNVIHASADAKDAEREIAIWFQPSDIVIYARADDSTQRGT